MTGKKIVDRCCAKIGLRKLRQVFFALLPNVYAFMLVS